MPDAYAEDQLVEQPAIGLLAELGWQTASAMEEIFGIGGTLGRETSVEVVLVSRLRAALAVEYLSRLFTIGSCWSRKRPDEPWMAKVFRGISSIGETS